MNFSKLSLSSLFGFKPKVTKQTKAYHLARYYLGLHEIAGKTKHEAKVVEFFKLVGHGWVKDDETSWCAAFVGAMLEKNDIKSTGKLDARSYLKWGKEVGVKDVKEGDIVVFWRVNPNSWQGHVGFFVRYNDNGDIVVLGGNQSDQVCERVYAKGRLLGFRRYEE